MRLADEAASLEVAVFIIGVAVKFSLPKTTDRLLRNVWKLACYAGFLTGREASRRMLPHARGSIFSGATASVRGDDGYAAFATAKFGLRAAAQSVTRELSPRSIHVAHLVIDAGVDTEWVRDRITAAGSLAKDRILMGPTPRRIGSCIGNCGNGRTHVLDLRPSRETW
jgi:NAD(P)-dependent dehydrogenase (short-subunit alcohol dehydrogenase family)